MSIAAPEFVRPSAMLDQALVLQTAGGVCESGSPHPRFFTGFLTEPVVAAQGLLAVADVAAARYFTPMSAQRKAAILDPVVTCDGECLRFESFSQCCGVYARFDVLAAGLDGDRTDRGTTNVDVNPPLRRVLAGVGGREPLHLEVGPDQLQVTTLDEQVVERQVTLPERWIRGFAEAPVAARTLRLRAEVEPGAARRFLRSLGTGSGISWALAGPGGLRLTSTGGPGAICVSGPQRLGVLTRLLRHAHGLRVYAPEWTGHPTASAWELMLPQGRLTLTLSPELDRGFSGEGGVLGALASVEVDTPDRILDLLQWTPGSDLETIAFALELGTTEVEAGLLTLGTSGRVGFDVTDQTWFHRELPWRAERTERRNPRLLTARRLLAAGAVQPQGTVWMVQGSSAPHQVRRTPSGWSCSCPWFAKYDASRGPCAHVLAVHLLTGEAR